MSNGLLFDVGTAREFHESENAQQEALCILRKRQLTKLSFERDRPGCRLAPSIDILRNGWGFDIGGDGSTRNPYFLLNRLQSPNRVRTTKQIQDAYYDSDHWADVRNRRYEFDNYRCVLCVGSCRDELQCHHIAYHLYHESLDDVMTVCKTHHEKIHEHCLLKFPTGVDLWIAERLLGVVSYPFPEWLLP